MMSGMTDRSGEVRKRLVRYLEVLMLSGTIRSLGLAEIAEVVAGGEQEES